MPHSSFHLSNYLQQWREFLQWEHTNAEDPSPSLDAPVDATRPHDDSSTVSTNYNSYICNMFQEYHDLLLVINDNFKAKQQMHRVTLLQDLPFLLTSESQVEALGSEKSKLKGEEGFTQRFKLKLKEIIEIGKFKDLEDLRQDVKVVAMQQLQSVHDIGPTRSEQLYSLGITSIDDLRHAVRNGTVEVSDAQRIGLQYVEEFSERIPRWEVEEVCREILSCAKEICPSIVGEICGSYRRGGQTCGDIDMILAPKSDVSHVEILETLILRLTQLGLITHTLSSKPPSALPLLRACYHLLFL